MYDDREFIFVWTVALSLPWNYKTISFLLYVRLVIGCRLVLLFFWRWIVNLHTQTHCRSPRGLVNVLASHPQVDWQIWSTEDQCTLSCFWMRNSEHVLTLVHTFMMCHSWSLLDIEAIDQFRISITISTVWIHHVMETCCFSCIIMFTVTLFPFLHYSNNTQAMYVN